MRLNFAIALLIALGAWSGMRAESSTDLDRQLAREPVEITTPAGRTFRGILDGFREGRLFIRLATDGGEVGYSFSAAELAAVTWPGMAMEADAAELLERGEIAHALPLMDALARQRLRYLPVLGAARQQILWSLVQHGATVADADRLQAVITALESMAKTEEQRTTLLEARLELALRSGRNEEARELACLWCAQADPAGPSARGWSVLARLSYQSGDYASARWYALQPLTFSSDTATRNLDACFALAITSAERLGDTGHARVLREEMASRQVIWPQDVVPADVRSTDRAPAPAVSGSAYPPAPFTPGGAEASARTLETLRKIPHRLESPPAPPP